MSNPSTKQPRRTPRRFGPGSAAPSQSQRKYRPDPPHSQYGTKAFEPVDPRWLLKAGAAVLALAVACGYATVCILFVHSQWQLVLDPSRDVSTTPAALGLPFTEARFDDDAAGQPQLDGWWIPSQRPTDPTVLMLHPGQGSISDSLPAALSLHNARLNVFLFDYRGFGHSAGQHPTQALMQADADAALRYLRDIRHIPLPRIVVYGAGVGASLATTLCAENSALPALILEAPEGDLEARARRDPRASLVPVRLLFRERFPLAAPLATLRTPKLLLSTGAGNPPTVFSRAADPKTTVELPSKNDGPALQQALRRFLDAYAFPSAVLPNN